MGEILRTLDKSGVKTVAYSVDLGISVSGMRAHWERCAAGCKIGLGSHQNGDDVIFHQGKGTRIPAFTVN